MRISPKMASAVCGARRLPSVTVVAALGTMIPALRNPDERDEEADALRQPRRGADVGMAETRRWRMPEKVSARKIAPERKTAPRAVCQLLCMPRTTV